MYEQAYYLCQNVEDIMGLFSEELRILDRNTVLYMIDEMQDKINSLQKETEMLHKQADETARMTILNLLKEGDITLDVAAQKLNLDEAEVKRLLNNC